MLRSVRQPGAPISVQRVALIGSSTARMISETRVSIDRQARRFTAAGTAHALHEAGAPQPGKELFEIGQGNFLPGGNIRQGNRLRLGVARSTIAITA